MMIKYLRIVGCLAFIMFSTNSISESSTVLSFVVDSDVAIGGISFGIERSELIRILGQPDRTHEAEMRGCDGLYQTEWKSSQKDVDIWLSGESASSLSVESMTVGRASKLKTNLGIGIGSTKGEVIKAYKHLKPWNDDYIYSEFSLNIEFDNRDKVVGMSLSSPHPC